MEFGSPKRVGFAKLRLDSKIRSFPPTPTPILGSVRGARQAIVRDGLSFTPRTVERRTISWAGRMATPHRPETWPVRATSCYTTPRSGLILFAVAFKDDPRLHTLLTDYVVYSAFNRT